MGDDVFEIFTAVKACGCIIGAVCVQKGIQDSESAAEIGQWVIDGLTVKKTEGPVKVGGCRHKRSK